MTNSHGSAPTLFDARTRMRNWHQRLKEHFARLAASRRELGWPVFALEHGLGGEDRQALAMDVRAHAIHGPEREVMLPWIVYAAEIGYEYSGHEYWQTFQAKTPHCQLSWRDDIRTAFRLFAKTHQGAEPDGNWARHFNIIAWPITHGVLPQDLQRQLAALLFEARWSFRENSFSSAETLGQHLQRQSQHCSSRFRQFAENTTLLGQIALALLLQQDATTGPESATVTLISADTLARIIEDLGRERDARYWLSEARSTASRFRLKGLSRISVREKDAPDASSSRDENGIRPAASGPARLPNPRFLLRESAADFWQVRIQFPNFRPLLLDHPGMADTLTKTQGRVGGPIGPLLTRGRLLTEEWPSVGLRSWPKPQELLLAFDNAPADLNAILHGSFRMAHSDSWLFAVGADGTGRQMLSKVLRPGATYILARVNEIRQPPTGLGLRPARIDCTGLFGLRIDVPVNVPESLVDYLRLLGVEVATTLEVSPAGLPAADWSGDGRSEWVSGAPIIIAVRADRRIDRLLLTLDAAPLLAVTPSPTHQLGHPLFISIPTLPPGHYRLAVSAETAAESADSEAPCDDENTNHQPRLRGDLDCHIREPRSTPNGVGALRFVVHPSSPSLEDVWEDRVEIHVAAPGTSSLRCRLRLRDKGGLELLSPRFTIPSPTDTDTWRESFAPIRELAEKVYDEAHTCTIEFDGGALGRAQLTAERDFLALRWAVRANGHRAVLIDSQGNQDLKAHFLRCAAPHFPVPLDSRVAEAGFDVGDGGGLLVGEGPHTSAATVVVPRQTARTFADLVVRPQVSRCGHNLNAIQERIDLAALWERARLGGSALAETRRQACVQALLGSAFGALGGAGWEEVESLAADGHPHAMVLHMARTRIAPAKSDEGTKRIIAERLDAIANAPPRVLEDQFVSVIRVLSHDAPTELAACFALRLATSPAAAVRWSSQQTNRHEATSPANHLSRLLVCQFVARAARYIWLKRDPSARRYLP